MKPNASKSAFHSRIHKEGRWEEYRNRREYYKRLKVPPGLAWQAAAQFFPPPEGESHEIELTQQIAAALDMVAATEASLRGEEVADPDCLPDMREIEQDFKDDAIMRHPDQVLEVVDSAGGEVPGNVHHLPPTRETLLPKEKRSWDELYAAVPIKRHGHPLACIQFVYDYSRATPDMIAPEDVPSQGALRHLLSVQSSPAKYDDFLRTLFVRSIPDKRQIERAERYEDDGSDQLGILDEFDAELSAELGLGDEDDFAEEPEL